MTQNNNKSVHLKLRQHSSKEYLIQTGLNIAKYNRSKFKRHNFRHATCESDSVNGSERKDRNTNTHKSISKNDNSNFDNVFSLSVHVFSVFRIHLK